MYVPSNVTQVIDVVHMNAQVMNQNKLIQIEVEEVHFQMLVSSGKLALQY